MQPINMRMSPDISSSFRYFFISYDFFSPVMMSVFILFP